MARVWSNEQEEIFSWFKTGGGNLVVEAFAGTGKSTTIFEGINRAPEQRIGYLAFAKRNQLDAAGKITNPNAEALTSNALGYRAVRRYWERIGVDTTGNRVKLLTEEVCGQQAPDMIKRLVGKLCTKARELAPFATAGDEIYDIAIQFDCAPDNGWAVDGFDLQYVADKAVQAMELAASKKPAGGIDFADMLFLPLRNKWLRPVFDLIVIDEAQDQTLVQLLLARGSCSGRIAVVGDRHQAIFAFRGADSDSLSRLAQELKAPTMPLSTTYRCGRTIVELAKRFVPNYKAAASNGEGVISETHKAALNDKVGPGDFILSRTNAPLVGVALSLIRQGRRAKIEGRDIGAGLTAIVKRLATGPAKNSIPKFIEKLGTWKEREIERATKAKLDNKVDQIIDQHETLLALIDGVSGVPELYTRLANLFDDHIADAPTMIVCSSVHRAKGLESDRVFVLRDTLNPPVACLRCHQRPKQCKCEGGYEPDPKAQKEEQNIEYVAITRAKAELVWVAGR